MRVRIVEQIGDKDRANPTPSTSSSLVESVQSCDDWEDYLSENTLRRISGENELAKVEQLRLKVDTSERSLGNFGHMLPSLRQLKLSDSIIASIRDLGTSLRHITVLWLSRCQLKSLDGVGAFENLKELYLAFNGIREVTAVTMLDRLEVLDLEGNDMDDLGQIEFLTLNEKLQTLTLTANPLMERYYNEDKNLARYRREVIGRLPNLTTLDDLPTSQIAVDAFVATSASDPLLADHMVVHDSLRCGPDVLAEHDIFAPGTSLGRPQTAAGGAGGTWRAPSARPGTARPGTARPMTATNRDDFHVGASVSTKAVDPSSSLTHGATTVLCGNLVSGLRRRKQDITKEAQEEVATNGEGDEYSGDDLVPGELGGSENVFEMLNSWRQNKFGFKDLDGLKDIVLDDHLLGDGSDGDEDELLYDEATLALGDHVEELDASLSDEDAYDDGDGTTSDACTADPGLGAPTTAPPRVGEHARGGGGGDGVCTADARREAASGAGEAEGAPQPLVPRPPRGSAKLASSSRGRMVRQEYLNKPRPPRPSDNQVAVIRKGTTTPRNQQLRIQRYRPLPATAKQAEHPIGRSEGGGGNNPLLSGNATQTIAMYE